MNNQKVALIVAGLLLVVVGVTAFSLFQRNPSNFIKTSQNPSKPTPTNAVTPTPDEKQFYLIVDSPQEGSTVSASKVEVRGRTLPEAEVFVNEQSTKADTKGNFHLSFNLQEGENSLVITAGNESGDVEVERIVYYELP